METERFTGHKKEEDQGAVALVLDPAKGFKRVSFLVVWARAAHFIFPRKILRVLCGYFEHQRTVEGTVRRMCGGAATNHFGHLARVQVEVACSCALCCRMH